MSRSVLTRTSARRAARPGALWGLVFGATIAASASTYVTSFPTAASRATLAQTVQGNVGFSALFGPLRRLDTVAGYTAYKSMYTVIILGAIWGLFIATKLLRGEEDTGRWELMLSGRTTRAHAARHVAIGLGVGLLALWLPTALLTILGGAPSKVNIGAGTAIFCATALVSSAAMFMAVGMVVSQLAATRHDANVIGAGVIAGSYLVRMVADSDPALVWLRWASPFGWIEELRPLTGSRAYAFVPIVVLTAVLVVVAIRIAARRDIGSSALGTRDAPKPRLLLLGGQAGLTVRLTRGGIIAWSVALAATGLCFGLVTQAAGNAAKGSPTLERVIE
ncbi:MAG TPA: ABC transporter permease subunit, partial [Acidimicrobiales bacterium]|nr:ABC transporter permease subunit [Acidimicrobiales bacterium]